MRTSASIGDRGLRIAVLVMASMLPLTCTPERDSSDTRRIESTTAEYAVLSHAVVRITDPETQLEQLLSDTSPWETPLSSHASFESGIEAVWVRMRVDNQSGNRQWQVVSEYAWIDSIQVYIVNNNQIVFNAHSGDALPFYKRPIAHRLPVIPIELPPGISTIFIRSTSSAERVLAFTLIKDIRDTYRFPRDLFQEFARLAFLAFIISITLAVYFRQPIHLYYALCVLFIFAYFFIWEGYGHQYLYPDYPDGNDHIQYMLGWLALGLLNDFWRRLLVLPVHSPFWNRALGILSGVLFLLGAYALWPTASFALMDIVGRILLLAVFIGAISSGVIVVRAGFRPAYYSLSGILIFIATVLILTMSGIGVLPGNNYTCVIGYFGYSLEFGFFLVSIVTRARLLEKLAGDAKVAVEIETGETTNKYSRLRSLDISALALRLRHLMEAERLYCDDDLTLQRLADLMNISRHQLSELIREVFHTTFNGYRNDLRIKAAARLLIEEPERTILSIAMSVGYNAKSSFNSAFRSATGQTPGEYRRSRLNLIRKDPHSNETDD
ncbi:MAG: helix-turn-helix domain-containing protein [Leptospiraceae bacterium]|nr:helix-turn-helix domain-containing protein [Leptospiraceae bacterium]